MKPDYATLLRLQERSLALQLATVRAAISHRGEKGENLERHAFAFLRRLLPAEYGIGTGFVAYRDDAGDVHLSEQLDVILYDAHRGGPLIDLGSVQVFPLESVFAYVEVKSELYSRIPDLIRQSARTRRMRVRRYRYFRERSPSRVEAEQVRGDGSAPRFAEAMDAADKHLRFFTPEPDDIEIPDYLPIRSFALSFEYGATFDEEAARALFHKHHESPAHFSAILVPEVCCVMSINANEDASLEGHVQVETTRPLATFRGQLLESLATFPRMPEGHVVPIDAYLPTGGPDGS